MQVFAAQISHNSPLNSALQQVLVHLGAAHQLGKNLICQNSNSDISGFVHLPVHLAIQYLLIFIFKMTCSKVRLKSEAIFL